MDTQTGSLPIFLVAEIDSWEGAGVIATAYGREDEVSPEEYGIKYIEELDQVAWLHPRISVVKKTILVPVSKLVATQYFVYEKHVKDLSTVPSYDAPILVSEVWDKYCIENGHHRACALALRGEKLVPVTVEWQRDVPKQLIQALLK